MTRPVDPAEIVSVAFDFGDLTAEPSNPAVSIRRIGGFLDERDLNAVCLVGPPTLAGSVVKQRIANLQAGTTYRLKVFVDAAFGARFCKTRDVPSVDR